MTRGGVDLGEQAEAPVEELVEEDVALEAIPDVEAAPSEQPTA